MSSEIPPEMVEEIHGLLRAGRKEEAVLRLREATGASERVAKAAVFVASITGVAERELPRRQRDDETGPPPPTAPTVGSRQASEGPRSAVKSASGCGSVVLLALGSPLLWLLL